MIQWPLTIWHKRHDQPYYFENSKTGVLHAAQVGATAIDLDCNITADGVIVVTHWARPLLHGFHDPHGKLPKNLPVAHMRLAEVQSLRSHDGLQIWRATEMLLFCKKHGITPCFEVKDDPRFEDPATYKYLVQYAEVHGVTPIIMTLPNLGGRGAGYRRLAAAKTAGLVTLVLTRGRVPKNAWQHVDLAKGPVVLGKPKRVRRLGPGSKYGISVNDRNAARLTKRLKRRWK